MKPPGYNKTPIGEHRRLKILKSLETTDIATIMEQGEILEEKQEEAFRRLRERRRAELLEIATEGVVRGAIRLDSTTSEDRKIALKALARLSIESSPTTLQEETMLHCREILDATTE
jgi:hypothetical protein